MSKKQAFASIESFISVLTNFHVEHKVPNFYDRCIDALQKIIMLANFYVKLLKANYSLCLMRDNH